MQTLVEFMNRDRLRKYKVDGSWQSVGDSTAQYCSIGNLRWFYNLYGAQCENDTSDWYAIIFKTNDGYANSRQRLLFWSPNCTECLMTFFYDRDKAKSGTPWFLIRLGVDYNKFKDISDFCRKVLAKKSSILDFLRDHAVFTLENFALPKKIYDLLQSGLPNI